MKEELSQTIDRLYKQENFKTLLSKLVSWILSEELEITDLLMNWKDGYISPIPSFLMNKLGSMFSLGIHGLKKNEHFAFLFFKCSADFGDAYACGKCAQFYFDGRAPEGKQLLLAEFYCRRALVSNSERFILLMANIFFLKNELRNTLVCTRDILSAVRTYDQVNYRKRSSRGELIMRTRQLEKDCVMQQFLHSLQDCKSLMPALTTTKWVAPQLRSPFRKASQLCNLYLGDQGSRHDTKVDDVNTDYRPLSEASLPSSLEHPNSLITRRTRKTCEGYLSLPGWTRINKNLDGFDAAVVSHLVQDGALHESVLSPQVSDDACESNPAAGSTSRSWRRYSSIQEHTIRRQLLAEKAFFQFSGCEEVEKLVTAFMKSRLREDDPRKQQDKANQEVATIRWPSNPHSPAGSIPSGRRILAAERLVMETSFKAYYDLGNDSRIFIPEDREQSLGLEDDNVLILNKDFYCDDEPDSYPRPKKLKYRQEGALFTGWSWQENLAFLRRKESERVVTARSNNNESGSAAGHGAAAKSPVRSPMRSHRPPFCCGRSKATSVPSQTSQQSKSFLEVNKSVEASEILPRTPVFLSADLAHRLAMNGSGDCAESDYLPPLMLTYPEEVCVGNTSLEYRHRVYVNLRSSESSYLATTLLEDPHEIVASINNITMSACDGNYSESESRLALLMIRFIRTGQPLSFYDLRDLINSRINDDQVAFLNAFVFHFFIKRLSTWILPFHCKLDNKATLHELLGNTTETAVLALLREEDNSEIPLASAQARALRLISEGYLTFAELFLPSSEYSIMHICYYGGGAEYSCCATCCRPVDSAYDGILDEVMAIRVLREKVIKVNDLYHQALLLHPVDQDVGLDPDHTGQNVGGRCRSETDEFSFIHYRKKHPQGQCLATLHASLQELSYTYGYFNTISTSPNQSVKDQSKEEGPLEKIEDSYLRSLCTSLFQ